MDLYIYIFTSLITSLGSKETKHHAYIFKQGECCCKQRIAVKISYYHLRSLLPNELLLVAVFLGCTSTGRVGLCFWWFYVLELPKAQPVVGLVFKRLRRRGNDLKSHPTDWETPGIKPATPGLQDIVLSPTPRQLLFYPMNLRRMSFYPMNLRRTSAVVFF